MDVDLSQFKASFLAECTEHIEEIEKGLLEFERSGVAPERLQAMFRAAHSVRGAAGTFGWTAIVRLAESIEELLDRMRNGQLAVSPRLLEVLVSAAVQIKGILVNHAADKDFGETLGAGSSVVLTEMRSLLVHGPDTHNQAEEAEIDYCFRFIPSAGCFQKGIDPLLALRELADFGMIRDCVLDVERVPGLEALNPMICHLAWNLKLKTSLEESEIRTAFSLIDGDAEVIRMDPSLHM